jgi:hypothetical protein
MPLTWERHDDYSQHTADGRDWLAATYDDEVVVYVATRMDRGGARGGMKYTVLDRRRALIDDRHGRDTAISELRAVCAEDHAGGR